MSSFFKVSISLNYLSILTMSISLLNFSLAYSHFRCLRYDYGVTQQHNLLSLELLYPINRNKRQCLLGVNLSPLGLFFWSFDTRKSSKYPWFKKATIRPSTPYSIPCIPPRSASKSSIVYPFLSITVKSRLSENWTPVIKLLLLSLKNGSIRVIEKS